MKIKKTNLFFYTIVFCISFIMVPLSTFAEYCSPTNPKWPNCNSTTTDVSYDSFEGCMAATCNKLPNEKDRKQCESSICAAYKDPDITYSQCEALCKGSNNGKTYVKDCKEHCETVTGEKAPESTPTPSKSPEKDEITDTGANAEACLRANCEKDEEGNVLRDRCNTSGYEKCMEKLGSKTTDSGTTMCGTSIKIDSRIPTFVSNIYNLLKIITPIALVLFGMLDFAKATVAHDDSAISKAGKKFIQRLIAGLAVFLVFTIVQFAANLLAKAGAGSVMECANCLLNKQC